MDDNGHGPVSGDAVRGGHEGVAKPWRYAIGYNHIIILTLIIVASLRLQVTVLWQL